MNFEGMLIEIISLIMIRTSSIFLILLKNKNRDKNIEQTYDLF